MTKMRGVKIEFPVSDRKSTASRDGVLRRSTQTQPLQGDVIGGWTIISESPVRNTKGVLEWCCRCDCGHTTRIPHNDLAYGAAPTCSQCAQQAATQRAQERAREKQIIKEAATELLAAKKPAQSVRINERKIA